MSTTTPETSSPGGEPQASSPPASGATTSRAAPGTTPPRRPRGTRTGTRGTGTGSAAPPPRTQAAATKGPEDTEIVSCWGQLLSVPAIIHVIPGPYQCEFCAAHIASQAPSTAKDLLKLSESHPQLRQLMENVTRFFSGVSLMGSVGELYGPSLANHGPEIPVVTGMGLMIGMKVGVLPHRQDSKPKPPPHQHTQQPRPTPPPTGTPNAAGTPGTERRPNPAPVAPEPHTGL